MYQVAWERKSGIPERDHLFLDTWIEVQDWIECKSQQETDSYTWTVSMVLRRRFDGDLLVPEWLDLDEKGRWINNLNFMMPNNLTSEEIASSLMSLASRYMELEDMARAFTYIGRMLAVADGAQDSAPKGSMH